MFTFSSLRRGLVLLLLVVSGVMATSMAISASGYPGDLAWEAVTYGNGKFVAVASSGAGNRVMTSTNGTDWVSRTSASDSDWQAITFADNLFVAVGTDAVMTSPDGITWTSRTSPVGAWQSVTNCSNLFVATATWGSNYVMTSPDGIAWTVRTPAYTWSHDAVACSGAVPRYVATCQFGRAWSSADGVGTWSQQNPGAIVDIRTIAFGGGRFAWLEYNNTSGNRYSAYSTNGVNWFSNGSAPANQWRNITYGNGQFVAVAEGGVNARVAYSSDGVTWNLGSGADAISWQGVAYGSGVYVAVANSGTGNRVMTSSDGQTWSSLSVTTTTTSTTTTTTTTTTSTTTTTTTLPASTTTAPAQTTVPQGQSSVATIAPTTGATTTTVSSSNVQRTSSPTTSVAVTSTTVKPVVTTTTVPVPVAPKVSSGESGALVDGKVVSTSLSRESNRFKIEAAGVTAIISGQSSSGSLIALDEDGSLRLNDGDKILVEGAGYSIGAKVQVWMYSTPTRLGTLTADSQGEVAGSFEMPSGIEPGEHRVTLLGTNLAGKEVAIGLGVEFGKVDSGSTITRVLISIPIALAVLFGLFLPAVSRRRRKAVAA